MQLACNKCIDVIKVLLIRLHATHFLEGRCKPRKGEKIIQNGGPPIPFLENGGYLGVAGGLFTSHSPVASLGGKESYGRASGGILS